MPTVYGSLRWISHVSLPQNNFLNFLYVRVIDGVCTTQFFVCLIELLSHTHAHTYTYYQPAIFSLFVFPCPSLFSFETTFPSICHCSKMLELSLEVTFLMLLHFLILAVQFEIEITHQVCNKISQKYGW